MWASREPFIDPTTVRVSIITGGRPRLDQRPTTKFLPALHAAGYTDIEYVLREDQAGQYERDQHRLNVYPQDFDDGYSRAHWRHPTKRWEPGAFHGAFTGREWAMRTAEADGKQYVLQLDDNVTAIGPYNAQRAGMSEAASPLECVNLLLATAASTNARMIGMAMTSSVPRGKIRLARPGYPYSVFVETVAPGRPAYYGPFEDDIMHALDYATGRNPAVTAAVMDLLTYKKESKSRTGMRAHYNSERGLGLVRHYPQNATLIHTRATNSPNDTARGVRHKLSVKGFHPVRVTDHDLYNQVREQIAELARRAVTIRNEKAREKIKKRAGLM